MVAADTWDNSDLLVSHTVGAQTGVMEQGAGPRGWKPDDGYQRHCSRDELYLRPLCRSDIQLRHLHSMSQLKIISTVLRTVPIPLAIKIDEDTPGLAQRGSK